MLTPKWGLIGAVALMVLAGCDSSVSGLGGRSAASDTTLLQAATTAPAAPLTATPHITPRLSASLSKSSFGKRVAQAVSLHPSVRAATADILLAQAELRTVSGAFRPEVSAGATATTRLNGSNDATPFLRVDQLLYDGGASRSRIAAQTASVTSSRSTRLVTASEFARQAVQVHVNMAAAKSIVDLTRDNLNAHRRYARLIQERRASGVGAQSDALTAQSRLADAETTFVNAQADMERARARYIEVISVPPTSTAFPPSAPKLPGRSSAAINGSPRMQALEARLAAAQAELEAARQGRRPRVEVGASAQRQQDGSGGDVVLDMSVDYTFDTRGEASAAIQRAYANTLRLESDKATLARDIARTLEFLKSDQNAGTQRLASARRAAAANSRNVRAANEEFSIGRRDLLQVLDAQRDLVSAQRTVVEAQQSILMTGYEAIALTGDIIPVFGISLQELVFTE
ncbi:MAG: TolC family protein [Paracoccaceae bacterium]